MKRLLKGTNLITIDGYEHIEIRGNSLSKLIDWLNSAKPLGVNYASYFPPEMLLICHTIGGRNFSILITYPNNQPIAMIGNYQGTDFILEECPDISEFKLFRDRTNKKNLLPDWKKQNKQNNGSFSQEMGSYKIRNKSE